MVKRILLAVPALMVSAVLADVPETVDEAAALRAYQLMLSPKRCISLHKGQTCFQKLDVKWLTPEHGAYCLLVSHIQEPLTCWVGRQSRAIKFTFNGSESISFQIKDMESGAVVASSLFEVAWVYRSTRKRNSAWRLF